MKIPFIFIILAAIVLCAACSMLQIPQIEDARCTQSRETVRTFFAQHFIADDEKNFTRVNIEQKQKFFTPEFYALMQREFDRQDDFIKANPDKPPFISGDPFTDSKEFPNGFKVGECSITGDSSLTHIVRLFWKIDEKASNKEMHVKMEKRGDNWLISDMIDHKGESLVEIFNREKYSDK